jgi:transposase
MFGRSKEGTWTPQVVVALAVTRDGLPVRSWVLPGNTTDVTTVKEVKKDLRGWNLSRAMFVADAGMNSEDNRSELARACGKYILACRMSSVSEIKKKVLTRRGPYTEIKDNLHCKEVVVGDGERRKRYILCHNPSEAERTRKHREIVVEELKQILDSHPKKNATAGWAAKLRASKRYGKYLSVSKNDTIRIDKTKIREAKKYDGKWVIETNDDTITMADAAFGYRSLMVIERCFRSLKKTQIQMTPMFHWLPHRIVSHVKICVLALLIERYAELQCKTSWHHISDSLDKLQASEFFSNKFRFYKRNEIPQETRNILKKLQINMPKQVLSVVKHS